MGLAGVGSSDLFISCSTPELPAYFSAFNGLKTIETPPVG